MECENTDSIVELAATLASRAGLIKCLFFVRRKQAEVTPTITV